MIKSKSLGSEKEVNMILSSWQKIWNLVSVFVDIVAMPDSTFKIFYDSKLES